MAASVAWSSSSASATVVGLAATARWVTSSANGSASITATAGAASGAPRVRCAWRRRWEGLGRPAGGRARERSRGSSWSAGWTGVGQRSRAGGDLHGHAGSGAVASTTVPPAATAPRPPPGLGTTAGATQTVSGVGRRGRGLRFFFNATAITRRRGTSPQRGESQGAIVGTTLPTRPSVIEGRRREPDRRQDAHLHGDRRRRERDRRDGRHQRQRRRHGRELDDRRLGGSQHADGHGFGRVDRQQPGGLPRDRLPGRGRGGLRHHPLLHHPDERVAARGVRVRGRALAGAGHGRRRGRSGADPAESCGGGAPSWT